MFTLLQACWTLIQFDFDDRTQKLLQDIHTYQQKWETLKDECGNSQRWEECLKEVSTDFYTKFLSHVAKEENVGLCDKGATRALLETINQEGKPPPLKKQKSQEHTETVNLVCAWNHLKRLSAEAQKEDPETLGLLDVEECIKKVHRILLDSIRSPKTGTEPGHFSTAERYTVWNDKRHDYPKFETEKEAERQVQDKIDKYNALVHAIIQEVGDPVERVTCFFKCAAWVLFQVISLHPFADGNGRICRLLCSYCLAVITPFPTPIYDVYASSTKDDYIDALVKARAREPSHPVELAALIVESNCKAWEKFIEVMEEKLGSTEYAAV